MTGLRSLTKAIESLTNECSGKRAALDGKFAGILVLLCGAIAAYGEFLPGSFDTTRYDPPRLSCPCSVALGRGLSLCPSGSLNSGNLPNVKLFPVGDLHECL